MDREISEKRALQYNLIYLYVRNSEAISNAMQLTQAEQKALWLNHERMFMRNTRYADTPSQSSTKTANYSSGFAQKLEQFSRESLQEREAELLKTATTAAAEVLLEIAEWDIPKLLEHIAIRNAEAGAAAEAGRLHNQAEHLLQDIDFWAKASSWTAEDAVLLSMSREPSKVLQGHLASLDEDDIKQSASLLYLVNTQALLQDAMDANVVSAKANLLEIVDWFNRMEIDFPSDLAEKVQRYHGTKVRTPKPSVKQSQAANAEKLSLLRLVAAMAVEQYGFSPKKNNAQVVSNVFDDLEQVGLGMSRKTVTKWLNEATSHIHPDKWKDG